MREANRLDTPDAWELTQRWWDVPAPLVIVGVLGPLSGALAVGAAALAHHHTGHPPWVVASLTAAAVLFAWGHPFITGPIGLIALAAVAVRAAARPADEAALRSA